MVRRRPDAVGSARARRRQPQSRRRHSLRRQKGQAAARERQSSPLASGRAAQLVRSAEGTADARGTRSARNELGQYDQGQGSNLLPVRLRGKAHRNDAPRRCLLAGELEAVLRPTEHEGHQQRGREPVPDARVSRRMEAVIALPAAGGGHPQLRRALRWVTVLFVAARVAAGLAQPVFTGTEIFPPEEFAARRAKVIAAIGDGVAVLQGTTERPGEQALRQNNQFFYLTGVVEPRTIAVIDGRSKKTTIFLQPYSERREQRMYGPGLHPGDEAARALGVDAVLAREDFGTLLPDLVR